MTLEEVDLQGPRDGEVLVEIWPRSFQLVTGRKWESSAFGGARGRTDVPMCRCADVPMCRCADVPKIVDRFMDGKLNIDDLITHKPRLEQINEGFDLMKRGESMRAVVGF